MSHAVFIWSSYAVAGLGFGVLALVSVIGHRRARRDIAARGLERKR
jgi:heme exporter protein CcmD